MAQNIATTFIFNKKPVLYILIYRMLCTFDFLFRVVLSEWRSWDAPESLHGLRCGNAAIDEKER